MPPTRSRPPQRSEPQGPLPESIRLLRLPSQETTSPERSVPVRLGSILCLWFGLGLAISPTARAEEIFESAFEATAVIVGDVSPIRPVEAGRPDLEPAPASGAPAPAASPSVDSDAAKSRRPPWRIGRTRDVFDGEGIATRVGGWLDASYQDNDGDASSSLNVNHFNLYFDTRLRASSGLRWQAFLEVEFENEPEARGFEGEREYEVEQAYGRVSAGDGLELRAGKFNTPFGIWTPLHWLILMDTITEPIHEGTRVTPEQQTGLEVAGRIFLDRWLTEDSELAYSVYAGYGSDSELFDESKSDGISIGSDLRLRVSERSLFGLSAYRQRRDEEDRLERTELGFMAYGELHPLRPLTLRFEIFRQLRDRGIDAGLSRNINIGYLKARWDFSDRVYTNYRYNYGDDEQLGTSDERHTHTVTLGYRPNSSLRVKLEFASTEFRGTRREDFRFWGISIGALF